MTFDDTIRLEIIALAEQLHKDAAESLKQRILAIPFPRFGYPPEYKKARRALLRKRKRREMRKKWKHL